MRQTSISVEDAALSDSNAGDCSRSGGLLPATAPGEDVVENDMEIVQKKNASEHNTHLGSKRFVTIGSRESFLNIVFSFAWKDPDGANALSFSCCRMKMWGDLLGCPTLWRNFIWKTPWLTDLFRSIG
jgi:hypothetical protein